MELSKLREALNTAAKHGKFGEAHSYLDIITKDVRGEDHFASDVLFGKVILQNGVDNKSVDVVIKRQKDDMFVREMMNTHIQFYNEFYMYDEILPFLEKNNIIADIFPKFIHGCTTFGKMYEDDILVIEDLGQFGYKLSDERLFLDFDHCALALKRLGQFHALSYFKKKENTELFYSKIHRLQEVRFDKDEGKDENNRFLSDAIQRGIAPLVEQGRNDIREWFKEKLADPCNFMKAIVQPEEPVAVLCHGDFCRNNMVFKYDDAGKPLDVKFFDVATARYASPAIDLAFFLLMNTSSELRDTHWQDLVKIYHDALTSSVPGTKVPSLDDINEELKKKAVYGYVICSFFIPMMMDTDHKIEDYSSITPEQLHEMNMNKGGELATKYVSDIVRHLINLGCL